MWVVGEGKRCDQSLLPQVTTLNAALRAWQVENMNSYTQRILLHTALKLTFYLLREYDLGREYETCCFWP